LKIMSSVGSPGTPLSVGLITVGLTIVAGKQGGKMSSANFKFFFTYPVVLPVS
jgi:hypothetical protein